MEEEFVITPELRDAMRIRRGLCPFCAVIHRSVRMQSRCYKRLSKMAQDDQPKLVALYKQANKAIDEREEVRRTKEIETYRQLAQTYAPSNCPYCGFPLHDTQKETDHAN